MNFSSDLKIGLRLALRARFFLVTLWLLVAMILIAWMAAQFSGRQPATVALDVGLSVIRLALPVVVVLLLQEFVSREFERRLYLTSLTYPRPRHRFLLGRFLALLLLVFAQLVLLALALAVLVAVLGKDYVQATPVALDHRYLITVAFLAIDLLAIAAVGTLFAVTASTPSFVLIGTLGFMIAARSFSAIVALLERESYLVSNAAGYQSSLGQLGYLLPDLASLDVRMVALYGRMEFMPQDWPLRVTAILAYVLAMLSLAVWAINRKRFA